MVGAQSVAGTRIEANLGKEWGRPWAHHGGRPSSTAGQSPRTADHAKGLATTRSLSVQCSMQGASRSDAGHRQGPAALLARSQLKGTPSRV